MDVSAGPSCAPLTCQDPGGVLDKRHVAFLLANRRASSLSTWGKTAWRSVGQPCLLVPSGRFHCQYLRLGLIEGGSLGRGEWTVFLVSVPGPASCRRGMTNILHGVWWIFGCRLHRVVCRTRGNMLQAVYYSKRGGGECRWCRYCNLVCWVNTQYICVFPSCP